VHALVLVPLVEHVLLDVVPLSLTLPLVVL